jgi:PhnB protein
MQVSPYLHFSGQCREAVTFYAQCFGAKIDAVIPYEGTPAAEQVAADWRNKIVHAHISVGGTVLMAMDAPPDRYQQPKGFHVSLQVDTAAEGERIFAALADKGRVQMPIQETFWAERFGMVVDRFGIPWMVNCSRPAS